MIARLLPLILFTTACGGANLWHLDSISAGDPSFDSSRLTFKNPHSHLTLELLRASGNFEVFLSLNQYTLTPLPNDPHSTLLTLQIDGVASSQSVPVRTGGMRIKLPPEMAARLILALQDGLPVGILVGGFQDTIAPESFHEKYSQFLKGHSFFSNLLKGPLE